MPSRYSCKARPLLLSAACLQGGSGVPGDLRGWRAETMYRKGHSVLFQLVIACAKNTLLSGEARHGELLPLHCATQQPTGKGSG